MLIKNVFPTVLHEMSTKDCDSLNNISPEYLDIKSYTTNENTISCSVHHCSSKPISRCVPCSAYYCHEHIHIDLHRLDNFEIINFAIIDQSKNLLC